MIEVTLLGDRTAFDGALSIVDFGEGTAIAEVQVKSAEELVARVRASPLAALGPRDVTVTTGTEIAVGEGLVEIVEAGSITDPGKGGKGGCSCESEAGLPGSPGSPGSLWGLLALGGLFGLSRRRRTTGRARASRDPGAADPR